MTKQEIIGPEVPLIAAREEQWVSKQIPVIVKVKKIYPDAKLPQFKSDGAVCADLYAYVYGGPHYVGARRSVIVETGIALEIPEGYEGQIRGRSGLAFGRDSDIHLGTIDADFRGHLKVKLFNHSSVEQMVSNGDRIAQIAIRPVPSVRFVEVAELSMTKRGARGFGSTGSRDEEDR